MGHEDLRQAAYAVYDRHWARVCRWGQNDPRRIWRRALRSLERTYGDMIRSLPHGARILDVGCGSGTLLRWLAEFHPHVKAVGVDVSPGQVDMVRQALPAAEVYQHDGLEFLKQHPSEFHGIFCFHLLEHLNDCELMAWLKAVYNALIPGGFFCYRTPNAANLTSGYHRYNDLTHVRVFASHALLQLADIGGFSDAKLVPIRPGWIVARLRGVIEHILHRIVFFISGDPFEGTFSVDVCAVAYRPRN